MHEPKWMDLQYGITDRPRGFVTSTILAVKIYNMGYAAAL